jgi:hypothetical protein
MKSLDFFKLPNPSGLTIALGSTQPLTQVKGIFLEVKAQPAHKADNITAICEPVV